MSRQIALFNTTPWTPPKQERRKRPADLLALISEMAETARLGCRTRVQWLAGQMGVCVRTIQRWLRKLSGKVVQIQRGYHRAAQYKLLPSTCQTPLPASKVSPQTVTPYLPSPYVPIVPSTICTKSANKPASAGASLTQRVAQKIQQAASRIQGAKNPYAYRQAIQKHEGELESADLWYAEEAQKIAPKGEDRGHSVLKDLFGGSIRWKGLRA